MKFLTDLMKMLSGFSIVDYILYFSVLALIILIVSLIYVIKNENSESEEVEMKTEENLDMFSNPMEDEEIDLRQIMDNINENPQPLVDMTAYENEQEQKAIISYDELVNYNRNQIHYGEEELVDDVIPVKKIQSSAMELPKKIDELSDFKLPQREPKLEVNPKTVEEKLFSYEKEEAFLRALQELNHLLN